MRARRVRARPDAPPSGGPGLVRVLAELLLSALLAYVGAKFVVQGRFLQPGLLCTGGALSASDAALLKSPVDLISACVVAPALEELVFRRWLLGGLAPRIGRGAALAVATLVFGAAHYQYWHDTWDPARLAGVCIGGLVYGAVYLRRGRWREAFLVHAADNTLVAVPKTAFMHCVATRPVAVWLGAIALAGVLAAVAARAVRAGPAREPR